MQQLKISESTAARRRVPALVVDATDGYSEETGLTPSSILVVKNGGAEASGTGTWVEEGHGGYYYEFTATELNTLGYVKARIVCTGARTFYAVAQVVAFDPYDATSLGLSRLDAAVSTLATAAALITAQADLTSLLGRLTSTRAVYLDNLSGGAVALASALSTAQADLTTLTGRLTAPRASALDNVDATISSRASASSLSSVATSASDAATAAQSVDTRVTDTILGRIDAAVTTRAPSTLTDSTIATATAAALATAHGSGSWVTGSGGATADEIATAVRDKAISGASTGSIGAALSSLLSGQTSLASAVAALPSAVAIASAVLAATLEGAHSVGAGLRLMLRVAVGRRVVSGSTITFRDVANSKNAIVATVDSSGNRSTPSTLDGS